MDFFATRVGSAVVPPCRHHARKTRTEPAAARHAHEAASRPRGVILAGGVFGRERCGGRRWLRLNDALPGDHYVGIGRIGPVDQHGVADLRTIDLTLDLGEGQDLGL